MADPFLVAFVFFFAAVNEIAPFTFADSGIFLLALIVAAVLLFGCRKLFSRTDLYFLNAFLLVVPPLLARLKSS